MSKTLLSLVQDILSDIDGDEVSSISGTIESQQIATLIKKQYEMIVERYELPALKDNFKLQGLGDVNNPTSMRLPDDAQSIEWVGYNCKANPADADNYARIEYLEPGDMMDLLQTPRSDDATTVTVTLPTSGVKVYVMNNKSPQFYSSFNDREVIFDSYNNLVDSTLQGSKTMCFGEKSSTLIIDDTTVIPLPQHLMNLLYTEALEAAFARWKEGPPQRIQQDAARSRVRSQRVKKRFREQQEQVTKTGPDYGRRPRGI